MFLPSRSLAIYEAYAFQLVTLIKTLSPESGFTVVICKFFPLLYDRKLSRPLFARNSQLRPRFFQRNLLSLFSLFLLTVEFFPPWYQCTPPALLEICSFLRQSRRFVFYDVRLSCAPRRCPAELASPRDCGFEIENGGPFPGYAPDSPFLRDEPFSEDCSRREFFVSFSPAWRRSRMSTA